MAMELLLLLLLLEATEQVSITRAGVVRSLIVVALSQKTSGSCSSGMTFGGGCGAAAPLSGVVGESGETLSSVIM